MVAIHGKNGVSWHLTRFNQTHSMFHAKIVGFLINKDMFLNEENQTN